MTLSRRKMLSIDEIQEGDAIEHYGTLYRVCRPIKDFYQHPEFGIVSNQYRDKFWVVPMDKPEQEPVLFAVDPHVRDVRVYMVS